MSSCHAGDKSNRVLFSMLRPLRTLPPFGTHLVPSQELKDEVANAVAEYMARARWKAHDLKSSPEERWVGAWEQVINHAVMAAQEGFMLSAARSEAYVGSCIGAFLTAQGKPVPGPEPKSKRTVAKVTGSLTVEQVREVCQKSGDSFGFALADVNDILEAYDTNNDGRLSFGEFVTMQFVPQYLSVQSQVFPTPEGVPSKEGVSAAGRDRLTPNFQREVDVILSKYAQQLRSQASQANTSAQSGRTNMFSLAPPPAAIAAGERDMALTLAVVEGQLAFMSVLLGCEKGNAAVAAACEQWKAYEVGNFVGFDKDGTGELDAAELAACMEWSVQDGMPHVHRVFRKGIDYDEMAKHFIECFDVNVNGRISAAEWLVACAAFQSTFLVRESATGPPRPDPTAAYGFDYPYGTLEEMDGFQQPNLLPKEQRPSSQAQKKFRRRAVAPLAVAFPRTLVSVALYIVACHGVFNEDPVCVTRGLHVAFFAMAFWMFVAKAAASHSQSPEIRPPSTLAFLIIGAPVFAGKVVIVRRLIAAGGLWTRVECCNPALSWCSFVILWIQVIFPVYLLLRAVLSCLCGICCRRARKQTAHRLSGVYAPALAAGAGIRPIAMSRDNSGGQGVDLV
mmetsp:Transcript_42214/g.99080  ORF Transcript_42214/g.99080 Transcript_42214/m.99080 type:complete len:621 (+) Transcript_42214:24-1886(+)